MTHVTKASSNARARGLGATAAAGSNKVTVTKRLMMDFDRFGALLAGKPDSTESCETVLYSILCLDPNL